MPQFPAAQSILDAAIRDRAFPGAAFGVWLRGQTVTIDSVGRFTYERDSPAIQPDTVFDMASLTKVMATTAMAMLLHERGQPGAPCLVSETWDDGRPIQAELALRATPSLRRVREPGCDPGRLLSRLPLARERQVSDFGLKEKLRKLRKD